MKSCSPWASVELLWLFFSLVSQYYDLTNTGLILSFHTTNMTYPSEIKNTATDLHLLTMPTWEQSQPARNRQRKKRQWCISDETLYLFLGLGILQHLSVATTAVLLTLFKSFKLPLTPFSGTGTDLAAALPLETSGRSGPWFSRH